MSICSAAGIIAEYNPLHNGHIYHIEKTRELTGCNAVIAAMSGDFVQRGEPAILDKWTRTALALRSGVDIVAEIPAYFCLGDAGCYARGGVSVLEALGCAGHLSFGSETGDLARLRSVADMLDTGAGEFASRINELTREGLSFPAARELAMFESGGAFPEDREILRNPNDTLAVEYIRALSKGGKITPFAIRREGAGYNEERPEGGFMSASGIRRSLQDGSDAPLADYLPMYTLGALEAGPVSFTDSWYDLLRYAVMSSQAEEIDECPSGGEGLGNLMKEEILRQKNYEHFINAVKSRRYTRSRLSRLCMQIILGISRSDYQDCSPGYVRILGFTEMGRELLSSIRRSNAAALPVITNINKESDKLGDVARRLLRLDIHASDIYNLATGRDVYRCSDHRMKPVML